MSLGDALFPSTETCLDCHDAADLADYGYEKMPKAGQPILEFSHKQHLGEGMDCLQCHADLVQDAAVGKDTAMETVNTSHASCAECHVETEAASACQQCHIDLSALRPLNHDFDFLHTHQVDARESLYACESCHSQEESCTSCHHGDNIEYLSHPRVWIYTHAQDAMKQVSDCASCHETETFCNSCHIEEGIRPADHFNAGRWLPPGNEHGLAARRDITQCASCHEEDDPNCTSCHRDSDNRLGTDRHLNIHPPNYRDVDWNGPWHDDDSASCFACHASSSRRTKVGFCTYCHSLD
jgi:hypothetical protein